jgi:hypothetical protein
MQYLGCGAADVEEVGEATAGEKSLSGESRKVQKSQEL